MKFQKISHNALYGKFELDFGELLSFFISRFFILIYKNSDNIRCRKIINLIKELIVDKIYW